MLTDLLEEVEQECARRNHEVALFLVHRLCNYQKVKLKLKRFHCCHAGEDLSHLLMTDEFAWREHRSLTKHLTFKDPCYRCPACRDDPAVLARLLGNS